MGNRVKLKKFLDEIGGFSLSTLRDRKILQKKIYLVQQLGFDLGYEFGFYIYGPYSTELTRDAFTLESQLEIAPEMIEDEELSESEIIAIENLNKLLEDINPEIFVRELELLTSIHFLVSLSYSETKTIEQVKEDLCKRKPSKFSEEEIEHAWRQLSKFDLL